MIYVILANCLLLLLVLIASKACRLCNLVCHIIMLIGDEVDETLILEVLAGGGKVCVATFLSITIFVSLATNLEIFNWNNVFFLLTHVT
jgi:hypothetical protein